MNATDISGARSQYFFHALIRVCTNHGPFTLCRTLCPSPTGESAPSLVVCSMQVIPADNQENMGTLKPSLEPTGSSSQGSSYADTTDYYHQTLNQITQILLPILACITIVCLAMGIIMIIKVYTLPPLKQHLAVALKRKRTLGKAPDNTYVTADDIRRSMNWDDRKSLPPPGVLLAARERASQLINP